MADENKNEMACVYAALVLHDSGLPIDEDKIKALTEAANVKVEPYWPGLFANVAKNVKMEDLISNIGAAPAPGAGAAAAGGAAEAEAPKEEEKEESEEEEEEAMDFDLFD